MNLENINFEMHDAVAILTMNRPTALNALSLELTTDLTVALKALGETKARAVILTGAGRGFSAGGDIRQMQETAAKSTDITDSMQKPLAVLHECITLIRETPLPFIAAVNGVCAGAGTNFALACDLVFAAENASFSEGFAKIGLTPDCGGTYFLPRIIGDKRTAEILMTGDSISARRAGEIGMINRVVADADLMSESLKMAQKLAQMPPLALARIKKMLNQSATNNLPAQLDLEYGTQLLSAQTTDFREGIAAFLGKRAPNFKGE